MEQIGLNFLIILGILFGLHFGRPILKPCIRAFRRLAAMPRASLVFAGAFPVVIRLALLPAMPPPEPTVHDEFAYLLQAETFAHGRWTNPPHPMWQHMETFNVIHQPTYVGKYFPGQAAFLAFGQVLTGSPWAGVLLSCALLCAAICWMLRSVIPPAWALLGALLVGMRYCVFTYWMNSYWGGALPALGGALVFGAVFRLKHKQTLTNALLLAAGLILLAITRPFEGGIVGLMGLGTLAWFSYRNRSWKWLTPVTVAGLCAVAVLAYGNYRVTGHPTGFAYTAYEQQYVNASVFLFQQPRELMHYRHPEMERFYRDFELDMMRSMHAHPWTALAAKAIGLFLFFVQDWALALPLVVVPFLAGWKRANLALAFLGAFLLIMSSVRGSLPHYVAPILCLFVLLLILAIHKLRLWNPGGKPTGSVLARLSIAAVFVLFLVNCVRIPLVDLTGSEEFRVARRKVLQDLQSKPGRHLVIVRYGPAHDFHSEWVYNAADIDRSQTVWARDMGTDRNRELLEYFRDRDALLLEPESGTALKPYKP